MLRALLGRTHANAFAVPRGIMVIVFGLMCLHCGLAMAGGGVQVCNDGDVTVKTTVIETSNPFYSATNYDVEGWYSVEPGKCSFVSYGGSLVNGVYLGFAYKDGAKVLRAHLAEPSGQSASVKHASKRFCVTTAGAFEYTTKSSATSCAAGYALLTFSLYIDFSDDNLGRMTFTVSPHEDEDGDRLGG